MLTEANAAPQTPDWGRGQVRVRGLASYLSHERQQHPSLHLPAWQSLCDPLQLLLRVPWMLEHRRHTRIYGHNSSSSGGGG